MSFQALRKTVASLLVMAAVTLSCAAPSGAAWLRSPRTFDEPARTEPARGFVSLLLRLLDFAGGAMDPNGFH